MFCQGIVPVTCKKTPRAEEITHTMPTLSPRYVSNWYYIQDNPNLDTTGLTSPQIRLFQNYSQTNDSDLSTVPLISGDIGPRIASVGGLTWKAKAAGPAVIFEDSFGNTGTASIFDTIVTQFQILQNPNYQTSAIHLMESASVNVSPEGVTCNIGFISAVKDPFIILPYERAGQYNFIGRTAKNFDTFIAISTFDTAMLPYTNVFQIIDSDISISTTIEPKYFPNGSQTPWLSIQAYKVSGNVTVLATPAEFENFYVPAQVPGTFVVKSVRSTVIQVGNSYLNLGAVSLTGSVSHELAANQLTQVKMSFENLLGYNGPIF